MSAAPSKLAALIAQREGFGIPGAIPTRLANPGDLTASPHGEHVAGTAVEQEPSVALGWADLERQLQLYADRGLTLQQAIYTYAPPPANDSAEYLAYVCAGLGVTPDTLVSEALTIPASDISGVPA